MFKFLVVLLVLLDIVVSERNFPHLMGEPEEEEGMMIMMREWDEQNREEEGGKVRIFRKINPFKLPKLKNTKNIKKLNIYEKMNFLNLF